MQTNEVELLKNQLNTARNEINNLSNTSGMLKWKDFLHEAKQLMEMSNKLSDTWQWEQKNENEGGCYLVYKQKINCKDILEFEMLQVEYHIVYSISYQVPMLYLQIHKSDGSILGLEDAWRIFRIDEKKTRAEMLSILTQMEHPVLYKPFMALHPCQTAVLLTQAGPSKNRILTFISLMGPYVQLCLNNAYALMVND